jgi:hypothetical protein
MLACSLAAIVWLPTVGCQLDGAATLPKGRRRSRCSSYRLVSRASMEMVVGSQSSGTQSCCFACHCGRRQSSPVVVVVSVHTGKCLLRLYSVVLVVSGLVRRVRRVTQARDGLSRRRSLYRLGTRQSSEHAFAASLSTPDSGVSGVATGSACRVTSSIRWISRLDRSSPSRPRVNTRPRSGEAEPGRARRGPPFLGRARRHPPFLGRARRG